MAREIVILFIAVTCLIGIHGAKWNHDRDDYMYGPSHWGGVSTICTSGRMQSPIQLRQSQAIYNPNLNPLMFSGYDVDIDDLHLVNGGHGAKVSVVTDQPQISGGGLGEWYTLEQFHFHSGNDKSRGSEHLLDSHETASEIHFVHFNDHVPAEDVLDVSNGIAVLGVLLKAGASKDHEGYAKVIKYLKNITREGDSIYLPPFSLNELMPHDIHRFYRYNGSLTTPPCSEAVVWTIFAEHVNLSDNQIAEFRKLMNADGKLLLDTHRPIQPLGNRAVYTSWKTDAAQRELENDRPQFSASGTIAPWIITSFMSAILATLCCNRN